MPPNFQIPQRGQPPQAPVLAGIEVVVIADGNYNGPDHKTLGWVEAGETIRVASGQYFKDLYALEAVVPVEEFDAFAEKQRQADKVAARELSDLDAEIAAREQADKQREQAEAQARIDSDAAAAAAQAQSQAAQTQPGPKAKTK